MKAKKYRILALLVTGICVAACWAVNTEIERQSLAGLKGIYVAAGSTPKAREYGLTKQALRTNVELRLRQNGIKVLSEQECKQTPGIPILSVDVNMQIHPKVPGVAVVGVSIELLQDVLLKRDPTKVCYGAATWQVSGVYLVGLDNVRDIRGTVKDHVDMFSNDYLAANPKEQQAKKDLTKGRQENLADKK